MAVIKRIFVTIYNIFPVLNRPMALCAAVSCAAVFYLYFNIGISLSLLILFAIAAIALCVLAKNRKIIVISILFLAVCASAVNEFMLIDDLETLDGKFLNADFVAVEDSKEGGNVTRVTAYCRNSSDMPDYSKFELYYYFKTEIKCGDRFNARVKLTKIEDNQYKADKFGRSVYMNCKIVKINKFHEKEPFFGSVRKVRRYIKQTINANFSKEDASLLIALNTGDKDALDDIFYDKVRTCGVSHIMVVSGLHISIILGSVFLLFEKFFYNKYLKALSSLILIFLLCAVCGFTVSVLRAGCMFIFSAISPIFMRKNDSLNSLGSAVVLLVFISPLCVLSIAFWLSVTATAAVVWIAPFYSDLITEKLKIENKILTALISIITVSVAAMIFTAPLSLAVFGYVSLLSPITFLLLTYPVTVALTSNSVALMFSACGISFISVPLFYTAGLCAKYIRLVIEFFGDFEFMCVDAEVSTFLVSVALVILSVLFMCLYNFYQRLLKQNYIKEVYAGARNKRKRTKKLTQSG